MPEPMRLSTMRLARSRSSAPRNWRAQLLATMLTLLQTLVLHKINPRTYLTAYLQACALNGSKAPQQLERWLPWNFIHHDAAGVQDPPVSSQARAP